MSSWFKLASIRTFGRLGLAALAIATVVIIGSALVWLERIQSLDRDWQAYETQVANKVVLLGQIRSSLGVGKLIDGLHRYAAAGKTSDIIEVHKNLLQLKVLIRGYRGSGTSDTENRALETISNGLDYYRSWLKHTELQWRDGNKNPDLANQVQSTALQKSLGFLDRELSLQRHKVVNRLTRSVQFLSFIALVATMAISALLISITIGFAWFFRSILRKPIESLVSAFDNIDPSAPTGDRFPVRSPANPNEVDQLALSGNRFLTALDIFQTERHKAEAALSASEMHVRAILQHTGEGIITIDSRGIITSFNMGAENIFDYKAEEIIGQNVAILSPPDDRPAHDTYVVNSNIHETRIINNARDLQGCRKDGTLFPLELHVTRMGSEDNKSFVGIMRDSTERVEAQHQLEEAVILAQSANNAKTEFLSSMSHELRTPMNTILGFSQLLESDDEAPLNEDQQSSVEHIIRSAKHLLSLINDILDLARVESGKVDISWEWIDLAEMVSICIDEMTPDVDLNQIIITNNVPDNPGFIHADYTKARQVLLNLLSNAVKYNQASGSINLSLLTTAEGYLRLGVTDTGPGLTEQQIDKIFVPFDRLDADMSEVQGTGIGLSISQKLIILMDGQIGIESTPGQGSTFWIQFEAKPSL
jgi:PAS domain S-box-containing protein